MTQLRCDPVPRLREGVYAAALKEKVRFDPSFGFVALRTNSSAAHAMAIVRGAGIGALPTYAPLLSSERVSVLPEFELRRDVWLAQRGVATFVLFQGVG